MKVVVLGTLTGIAGSIANRLAALGHEAIPLPGQQPPEILIGFHPELLVVVASETGMEIAVVERVLKDTGAPVVAVAAAGDPWLLWAEARKFPVLSPERAAEELAGRLSQLVEQARAGDRERYLQQLYRGPVIVGTAPRVIGFGGPKGGTGKSSLAANAAAMLAALGVPAAAGPPPAASPGIFQPGAHVPTFWTSVPSPKGVRWDLRLTAGVLVVDQILGERSGPLMARAADWLEFGVRRAASEGYTVILDSGNNLLSPLSLRALNIADVLFIVLEPEDTGLIAGASWLAAVYRMAGPAAFERIRVVFNKVRAESGDLLVSRLRDHVEAILRQRLPRALPVRVLPLLDVDVARAQANLRLGVEFLAALQALTQGRYAAETASFAEALRGMLAEFFPAIAQAASSRPEPRGGLRLPWRR
jgi:Mrp family chromosome partitioning ATPase